MNSKLYEKFQSGIRLLDFTAYVKKPNTPQSTISEDTNSKGVEVSERERICEREMQIFLGSSKLNGVQLLWQGTVCFYSFHNFVFK